MTEQFVVCTALGYPALSEYCDVIGHGQPMNAVCHQNSCLVLQQRDSDILLSLDSSYTSDGNLSSDCRLLHRKLNAYF